MTTSLNAIDQTEVTEFKWPKITVVTPNFNGAQFLENTLLSVLDQHYPNLEYIVMDGGSSDGSIEIIRKYEDRLAYWESAPDQGMYDAIQKGFDRSTGEIMGWLNSDDLLHRGALWNLAELFALPGVHWLMGLPTMFDERSRTVHSLNSGRWSKFRFHLKDQQHIQQESTYWSRELWQRAGAHISIQFRYAGDFELWCRFFRYEKLYTPSCLIGGFRYSRKGQLSFEHWEKYKEEMEQILQEASVDQEFWVRLQQIKRLQNIKAWLRKSRLLNHASVMARIDRKIESLHDYPAAIRFNRLEQRFYLD